MTKKVLNNDAGIGWLAGWTAVRKFTDCISGCDETKELAVKNLV
jgi:hypothetical protein